MSTGEMIWLGVGAGGQACFAGRMVVQWYVSERCRQSIIPVAFWHLSLLGGILTLAYAVWRRDPVFVGAQALGLAVYLRNLRLLSDTRGLSPTEEDVSGSSPTFNVVSDETIPAPAVAGSGRRATEVECRCLCTCGAQPKRHAA